MPLPALRPFVAAIALNRSAPHMSTLRPRLFPDGQVELVISIGARPSLLDNAMRELPAAAILFHPTAFTDFVLPGGLWTLQVTLTLRGAYSLFGGALAGSPPVLAVPDLNLPTFTSALQQLCELPQHERISSLQRALLAHIVPERDLPSDMCHALTIIHGSAGSLRVRHVATRVGLSQRQLERRFSAVLGCTPKQYARVIRFNRARTILDQPGFAGAAALAADLGYTDQTHMIDEFKSFAGMNPLAYRTATLRGAPNPFTNW
jgi:AraC-like DNA-binding protein